MREALAIVAEEGLEQMWARHRAMHERLWRGLGSLGLEPLVQDPDHRLPSVNAIKVSPCQTLNQVAWIMPGTACAGQSCSGSRAWETRGELLHAPQRCASRATVRACASILLSS